MNATILTVLLFSVVLPLGLLIWWKKKTGAKLWCFFAGAVCFFVFANLLEGVLHQLCLNGNNAVSAAITGSPLLYMLYGSFAAGIFEETGRLFGFKVLLRKHKEKECAVAYGIGHGGIEVLLLLFSTYLLYFLASLGVTVGNADTTAQMAAAAGSITFGTAGFAMIERISAMLLHIGLSMMMFAGTKEKGKLWLYPVCICIHALADMPACLYQFGLLRSIPLLEVITFILGLVCLLIGARVLRNYANRTAAAEEAA